MKNSILILGGAGLLGTPLTSSFRARGDKVYTVSQTNGNSDFYIDATDKNELDRVINATKPDYILNLIAITNVDWCESNLEKAYNVHVSICQHLSDYSKKYGTRIVHISTDHIYNDYRSDESSARPINVYALTKLMGELELMNSNSTILRTNFFGKSIVPNKRSLTDVMYSSAKAGKHLTLFNDVYFSPLSINTLCDLIIYVVNNWNPGVYNLGSNNGLSKSEFILKFINECNVPVPSVEVKSIDSLDFTAKRPKDMRMNCDKFENTFCMKLPDLSDEIKNVAREFCE